MAIAVANRYARALADVVAGTGNYRAILGELEDFTATYGESTELREVLATPAISLPEKLRILEAILARLETSPIAGNFVRVLLSNYRLGLLREVVESFRKIAYERLGIAQVKVFSATSLSETEREALRERFARLTRKQVELELHLDPELLGGLQAQIGSAVYDGSIRGHLERLRQQLVVGR